MKDKKLPENQLTFSLLQEAVTLRNNEAFAHVDDSDLFCAVEIGGETGELLEYVKKEHRDGADNQKAIAKELADIITCVARLASRRGIDLGQAITNKFNEVSARSKVNSKYRISKKGLRIKTIDLESDKEII